jgi:FixJ family two-component response regulator
MTLLVKPSGNPTPGAIYPAAPARGADVGLPTRRRARRPLVAWGSPAPALAMSPRAGIVYVVDDDVSVRESLELLLRFEGFQVETFASARDFLERSRTDGPGCVVLDVSLPDLSGLDLQKLLLTDRANLPIIFITGYGDVPTTVQAMKAGAVEFLTKPLDNTALIDAIRPALERSGAAVLAQAELRALRERYAALSEREREVMALVVTGMLNKQVGTALDISEITVKAHRGKVMRKMQAESFAELVNMAASLGVAAPKS